MIDGPQGSFDQGGEPGYPGVFPPASGWRTDVPTIEGLPADWDPQFIPDPNDLESAALKAMHEVRAFLLIHWNDPPAMAEHMDWLVGLIQAAVTVRGRHRAKAIELGLALRRNFWQSADRIDRLQGFLLLLLSACREIESPVLEARVYQAWGVCMQTWGEKPNVERALENALEIAVESHREDVALLVRAELFNVHVPSMDVEPALSEANELLVAARRLEQPFVMGRVYLSLARLYGRRVLFRQAFMYAQQAFIVFASIQYIEWTGEPLVEMVNCLQSTFCRSDAYRWQILQYLERHPARLEGPRIQAAYHRNVAIYWYRREEFELARRHAVQSYCLARTGVYPSNILLSCQMLGLVQTKRKQWGAARHYLTKTAETMKAADLTNSYIAVKHALAFIPFEQHKWHDAIVQLSEVLLEAREVLDDVSYARVRENIEGDIREAQQRLTQQ